MSLFLAKLTLTPLIMYLTSAAGRHWGPGVSGWLTGLPLLAGPVSGVVLLQTGIAGWLGPRLSGRVTPFPIVVILLTAFAHHQLGAVAAYLLGLAACLGINGLTLWALRRRL